MSCAQKKRHVSVPFSISEFQSIEREAARLRIPMTDLCRKYMQPKLQSLLKKEIERRKQLEEESN